MKPKTEKQKEFLNKLADLVEQYDASFEYTTDDDGIHISVEGDEVFGDFLHCQDAAELLRAAGA